MRRIVGRSPDTTSWQYLATVLGVLGVLLGAGAALLRTLGLLVHRQRENLIDSPPLQYPEHELLLTGLDALWELPWRGLSALMSSHGALGGGAWALLGLSVAVVLGGAWLRRTRRAGEPLLLATASLITILLFASTVFTTIAVRARNLAVSQRQDHPLCTNRLTGNWADKAAFEACTWLTNESAENDRRRESLGGLPLWLLAAVVATGLAVHRTTRRDGSREGPGWRAWRLAIVVALAFVGLLVLRLWPTAHAYATWGLKYPAATLGSGGACQQYTEEAEAVAANLCCAYDVTDVADGGSLLLFGPACPDSLEGTLPVEERCFRTLLGDPQVIGQECP